MPPTQANTFVILVKNELGFTIKGDGMENETLDDPTIVLHPVVVEGDSITLTWSRSTALGDEYYQIFEASIFGSSCNCFGISGIASPLHSLLVQPGLPWLRLLRA